MPVGFLFFRVEEKLFKLNVARDNGYLFIAVRLSGGSGGEISDDTNLLMDVFLGVFSLVVRNFLEYFFVMILVEMLVDSLSDRNVEIFVSGFKGLMMLMLMGKE